MFPTLSAPLIKDIRTGEGILEWATGGLILVSHYADNLSIGHTATYLTVLAAVKGARRTLLKIVALQKGAGIAGAPIVPDVLDRVETDIKGALHAADAAQEASGLDASKLESGLAPTPVAPVPDGAVANPTVVTPVVP